MSKKKSPASEPKKDRHKPRRMVPLPEDLYLEFQALATKRFRSVSKEMARMVAEELRREKLKQET